MKKLIHVLIVLTFFVGCLTAPDLNRDSILDKNAGIPYILDSRYVVDHRGLIINWTDGSLENDLFLLEQIIYDKSGNELDSLVSSTQLESDRSFFIDPSKDFGYPYIVYLRSQILDGSKIKAEVIDTINIEFGKLTFTSQEIRNDYLYLNWNNIPNIHYSDSILVDKFIDNKWQQISKLKPNARSYRYPAPSLTGNDQFRISSSIINYNGSISRTSSFEVVVD